MALALVRIDDRLVHGQVVEGWIPYLKADRVIVASDAAAQDETQVALMRLALPDAVAFEALPVSAAAGHPSLKADAPGRALVLTPGPQEVLGLLDGGAPIGRVNVGGLHYTAGKVQLGKAIFISEDDRQALRQLSRRGVVLEGRALPSEKAVDVLDLLESQGEEP